MPNNSSPIGFLLASVYQVPLYTYTYLFLISMALTLLISLYLNEKRLIPLLSMIPFLFLGHAGTTYYTIPITAFAMVINANTIVEAKDRLAEALAKSRIVVFAFTAAMILCVLSMFIIAFASHAAYNNEFGLYAHNQSIEMTNATTLTYRVQFSYNPGDAMYVYPVLGVANFNETQVYHILFNQSAGGSFNFNCNLPCSKGIVGITLPSSGRFDLTATLPANITSGAYIFVVLLNGNYYYRTQTIR
jgi:hypothetical protein